MAEIPNNSPTRLNASGLTPINPDTPVPTILQNIGSEYTDADLSFLNKREEVPKLPNATVVDDDQATDTPSSFNGQNPDTVFDALNSMEGWAYNKLGDYHLPTYKIRFFMTDDSPINFYEFEGSYEKLVKHVMYDRKQTTIVESGVTGMNISGLEMVTRASPNIITRSMTTTEMVMSVHEPLGVNLMDILASTAKELGVKNYSKTGYFVEIKFQGYEDEYKGQTPLGPVSYDGGKIETNIYKNSPNKGVWLYYVHLTSIQSEINSTGSNYKLTLQMFEELFHDRNVLQIPDTTMPQGATIGEMLADLATKLNASVVNMYGYQLIEYDFKVKPVEHRGVTYYPDKFKVHASKIHFQDRRTNTLETAHRIINGSFARGTMIHDAVEMIFGASEEAQKLAKDVSITEELNSDQKEMRHSVVWRCRPVAEHKEYDFATETYVSKYTLVVSAHTSQIPVLTREQVEISKDPEVQKKNLMMLRRAGYLGKRYDYIFSGQNTEVINFDLKLNMQWSNVLPKVMGLNNSMPTQAAHDIYRNERPTFNDLKSKITSTQSRLSELVGYQQTLLDTNDILLNLDKNFTSEEAKNKARDQAMARQAAVPMSTREISEELETLKAVVAKERQELQDQGNARIPGPRPDRETVKYAEEIEYEQRLTESIKPIPVSVTEANEDTRFFFSGGTPDSYHRDRAIMGAIMDQIYNVSGMEMLQNISLEVVGDPYWLGGGNIMRTLLSTLTTAVKTMDKDPNDDSFGPNYDKGPVLFLLHFRYPNGVADDGSPILKPHEFFTGIYQVTEVTHNFSGGQFRQTLKATRHKLQDIFKAFGAYQEPQDGDANSWTG